MVAKIKSYLLALFLKLIPSKYYSALIMKLQENRALQIPKSMYRLMDYSAAEIFLSEGIRVNSCHKEPETVRWVETHLKSGQVFYDIGANVGAYSLIAAKYHHGTVTIYAFEPALQNFPLLVENIRRNGCHKIIKFTICR